MSWKKLEEEGPVIPKDAQALREGAPIEGTGFLGWLICVCGWLICAFLCLWLMISLEAWPSAYDMFFWAAILVLFCNILVFLFISARYGAQTRQLSGAVLRVCVGEGLLLLICYLIGRFAIGQ